MKMRILVSLLSVLSVTAALVAGASAQICSPVSGCQTCADGQTYKIVYQTVCEQRQATAYRVEYETVCEQRQVTSYKPVWETAVREHRYTVQKPVFETSVREERYTVQRPVYETAEREECYTVMRPVYETAFQTQYRTVMQPVVTCETQYVDRGCYAEQMVLKPGWPRNQLKWLQATCTTDPITGRPVYQRAGLYWVPTQSGRYEVKKVWQPNVVAQQVQKTCYVPQTVTEQVPYQVCKYVPERIVKKVPYQVCRMVTEQRVRKVPVRTCRMVCEERVEQVPYQVCRMVAQQRTISVPRVVEKRTPVTYTYTVPRVVCYRIPLDACGNPIIETVAPSTGPSLPAANPTPANRQPSDPADRTPSLNGNTNPASPYGAEKRAADESDVLVPVPRNDKPAPAPSVYDTKRA